MRFKTDKKHRAIMRHLLANGRMSNRELAAQADVDLSAPPCLRRIAALEEAGIIRGFHADIDPAKVGFTASAVFRVRLTQNNGQAYRSFHAFVNRTKRIVECFSLTGHEDYQLKVMAEGEDEMRAFRDELVALPYVATAYSAPIAKVTKQTFGPPI